MLVIDKWGFPFFFLFVVFCEHIFYTYLTVMGISSESGQMKYLFMGIASISFFILLNDLLKSSRFSKMLRVLIILGGVLLLYYLSSLFQNGVPILYYSELLRFGSLCIPSAILGMHLAGNQLHLYRIDNLLPLFLIPLSLIIGFVGFKYAIVSQLAHDDSGLNYQSISYYMAEMYAYCVYYIFFSSARSNRIFPLMRIAIYFIMLFCSLVCFLSGGRGAFIFIIAVTIFLIYLLLKNHTIKLVNLFFIIILLGSIFSFFASKYNVWYSTGFRRITDLMMNDEIRDSLRRAALESFADSPVFGYGLGSVWWTVGYYTHNILLDLFVEVGIVGTLIIVSVFIKMILYMYKLSRLNMCYIFLLLIFLKTLIMLMFSGYWFATYQLWLIFGFVFVQDLKVFPKPHYHPALE